MEFKTMVKIMNSIPRLLFAAMAFVAAILPAGARQLSVNEAVDAAGLAMMQTGADFKPMSALRADKLRLLRTERKADLNTIYIMSDSEGSGQVVFLAADDVAAPLLGYCDTSDFEINNMPPALQYMLDCYSNQIAQATARGALPFTPNAATDQRADIAPLVKTLWDQGEPYNQECPRIDNTATYTGCVATAMAQVMNYHRWPNTATGFISYAWGNGGTSLSMDFSTISFDWANMLNVYTVSSPLAARQAVATLMKACGYSIEMNYGTDASGAWSANVGAALINYFGYAKNIRYLQRNHYLYADWLDIIYGELAAGRPVQYGGYNSQAGHSFVIDGYRAEGGYFHVNWGWSGMSNGYFLIYSLDPDSQGIGGSMSGYDDNQDAIVGVQRDFAGSDYFYSMATNSAFTTTKPEYSRTENIIFGGDNTWFFTNATLTAISGSAGVKMTSLSTGASTTASLITLSDLKFGYGYQSMTLRPADVPAEGEYIVEPTAIINGSEATIQQPVGVVNKLKMTVSANDVTFEPYEAPEPRLKATAKEQVGKAYLGYPITVQVTIENSGDEFLGTLELRFLSGTTEIGPLSNSVSIDIPEGETRTVTFHGNMPDGVEAGKNYTVRVYNGSQGITLPPPPLTITPEEVAAGTPSLTITSYSFEGVSSGNGSFSNPAKLESQTLDLTAYVTNSSGVFSDEITGYVYDTSNNYAGYLGYQPALIGPGDEAPLDFSFNTSTLDPTKTYYCLFHYYPDPSSTSGSWISNNYFYFIPSPLAEVDDLESQFGAPKVTVTDGTVEITAAEGIVAVDMHSMLGINYGHRSPLGAPTALTIETDRIPAGMYLVTVRTTCGLTVTKKITIR